REPGQVADDRADARAATTARRQRVPRAAGTAHLERAVACELEHLPVEEEEAGETEPSDQRELVVEALARAPLEAVGAGVALHEGAVADRAQLPVGQVYPVREVGVAIAELLRQVELASFRDLARSQRSLPWQPLEHLLRRAQERFVVAPALPLAAVEGRPVPDRDEGVLQERPSRVVRVHVAGGH